MTDTFTELREIARLSRRAEHRNLGRDRLIRFLDTYSTAGPELPIVDSLCASFGLFPYMSTSVGEGSIEALAVEYHTPQDLAKEGFTFHAKQQEVYQRLMDGENVILSAPTSFGKSAILDALVASNKWSNIVVIVPTIALIDETRRRISRFRDDYTIITSTSQTPSERSIFVLTQERFLELPKFPSVDLFLIDEFYKLGSVESFDQRRSLLNLTWKKLKDTGAQYYLIGPNIDSLVAGVDPEVRANLVRTEFTTVVVDVIDRSGVEDQLADLKGLLALEANDSTLVFSGSPDKAETLATELLGSVPVPDTDSRSNSVADWLSENYDPAWRTVVALKGGISVHTGVVPRPVQRMMVRLFNAGNVPAMVCTSTLIEGVNTSAKNVVIYDHKIDNELLSFFTFSNIRGRAGRMFRHFVGKVYTYSAPPVDEATEVDIPIESQSELASLATLAQLEYADLQGPARERAKHIFEQDVLGLSTIRSNRGLDPDLQIQLATRFLSNPSEVMSLGWSGSPNSSQLRSALKIAFDELLIPRQRRGINFDMLWGKLQNARINAGNFSAMVSQQEKYLRPGQDRGDAVMDVLRFQRSWMGFTIPSMLRGLQSIQSELGERLGAPRSNYEFVLREVESLYLAPGLVELEEYGIPIPLGIKLKELGLQGDNAVELILSIEQAYRAPRVIRHLSSVEQWILDDVVEGMGGGRDSS
ncbi:DEAD/DEAH box helicase [Cryobacterium zongtaii]|nr:DEAD/DEAH box helicase [Cryobacterium zongtaii]